MTIEFKSIDYTALQTGPRLIVTGAVHGNETCGTHAIWRLVDQIDTGALHLVRGALTLVPVTNPLAYALGQRSGERNLNRKLFPSTAPADFEDRVANWLCPLLARHDVLLDLHSFSAAGEPFVMVGPRNNHGPLEPFTHAHQERLLARRLGVRRFVDGWLATYGQGVERRLSGDPGRMQTELRYGVGTTECMRMHGGYALTLECGQHDDPAAREVAYLALLSTLAHLRLVDAPEPQTVALDDMEALSMVAVYDKLHDDDTFSRPWQSFDALAQGARIGTRADGSPVLAEFDGRILFPDAGARAHAEWYYMTRPNDSFMG